MSTSDSYALVTPCRNEAENLRRLGESLLAQTIEPSRWIIVDNGSTDATGEVARQLAAARPWIVVLEVPGSPKAAPGAPIVRAFNAGLAELRRLGGLPSVVVKLDADISMDPEYFDLLLGAFTSDPALGIASGACLEQDEEGVWRESAVSDGHARGAVRAYRAACLEQVLPLVEGMGWDGIDELKANVCGWRTGIVPGLAFRHHRPEGARDGGRFSRWRSQGEGAHYMGYRFWFLTARALHRSVKDPAALAMIWGYASAAARRAPVHQDEAVRAELRRRQSPSILLGRLRGRASGHAGPASEPE